MVKQLFDLQDNLDVIYEKMKFFLEDENFIKTILYPKDFLDNHLPVFIKLLETVTVEKNEPYTIKNKVRKIILECFLKISIDDIEQTEFIVVLNNVLENDNLENVILSLKIFYFLHSSSCMTEEILERHFNIILSMVNSIFGDLSSHNKIVTMMSLRCLALLFGYLSKLNKSKVHFRKKIELVIFRCVNFYTVYLDNSKLMEMMSFNKNIEFEIVSSLNELFKLILETNGFMARNESFSSTILELMKFSIFFCSSDAFNLRNNLVNLIFKIVCKSNVSFLPKYEDFFSMRFFYCVNEYEFNTLGLIGLTDFLILYSDKYSSIVFFELLNRTFEILETSFNCINYKIEKDLYLNNNKNIVTSQEKFNEKKDDLIEFHSDNIKNVLACLLKQVMVLFKSKLHRLELSEYLNRVFVFLVRAFKDFKHILISLNLKNNDMLINGNDNLKDQKCSYILNCSKSIFIISSKIFKDIYEKIIAIEKNSTDLSLIDFKNEYFFCLFDSVLFLINFFELEDNDSIYLENFLTVFLIPTDCLFRDLNNRYKYTILELACQNIYYFEVVKVMSGEIVNQVCCNFDYLDILCRLLTYDFNYGKFSILENNESLFEKYKLERQKDNFNFYNIYFTIMINYFCSNMYRVSQQEVELLAKSFDLLVYSKDEYLYEILLLCFKSINSLKEGSNMFQNHLIKVWKEYLDIFYDFYINLQKKLYLDLIFSIPINLNFLISDWHLLIKPITEAIKIRGETGAKAMDHLCYILDNSKKDTFSNNLELSEMFAQIKNAIDDSNLSVYCAQILGKLKSYQKTFINKTLLFEDRSFIRGLIFVENRKIVELNKNAEFKKFQNESKNNFSCNDLLDDNMKIDKNKILIDDLIIEIIQFFRGKYVYNRKRSNLRVLKYVRFKNIEKKNKNLDAFESAFNILCGFIYTILGISDYENYKILEKTNSVMKIIHDQENMITILSKMIDADFYLASLKGKSYLDQVRKTQYLYDSLLALFACENTPFHEKAKEFLMSIGYICINYWFINCIFTNRNKEKVYFNNIVIVDAILESFVNDGSTFPDEIFHCILNHIYNFANSDVDLVTIGILDKILKQIRKLCYTSIKIKKKAGINALRSMLVWDKLPLKWFVKNIFEFQKLLESNFKILNVKKILNAIEILFRKLYDYFLKLENGQIKITSSDLLIDFTNSYFTQDLKKNDFSYDTIKYKNFIHSNICNTLMNALLSKNIEKQNFSKQILILYYNQFKVKQFLKDQRSTLFPFLLELDNTNSIVDIYSKIDVFVFLFVNFTFMFGKKEAMLLTKVFYYALKTKNEFKYEGKGNFETDIFFINSEFFLKFSEDVLNCKNTIFHLYYKKNIFNHNEQKENENYLKSMITFLFLMYSKNTENAKHAFDFMFNNLPNGFLIPIEKLLYMNKDLITNLLNLKYKECFSEKLNVTTAKKLICIISLLQIQLVEINSVNQVQDYKKFKDDKLVLFIISVFEEFINQREILLYSENPENSIMAKTFELCLIYPYQELLYDKMILYVYPILYEYGKSYIFKIESKFVEYIEKFSHLCYPLIVKNVYNNSLLYLTEVLYHKIISFKNYVSNLGIFNSGNIFDITFFLNNLDLLNYADIRKAINVFKFIKLIELPVNAFHIRVALIIFGELKRLGKDTHEIKDFIGFSINSFTPEQFDLLFQIDPLFKIFNTVKVNTLSKVQKKIIRKYLLKSLQKENFNSFENLIKLFEEDSWMLIDIFVDLDYFSAKMIEYCIGNLDNLNIRASLLYYLSHFRPKAEYFALLLDFSYEEKNYILTSLKNIVESNLIEDFEEYENLILTSLKCDSKYKFNFHVIFPLLINYPKLLTKNICKELFFSIIKLFNLKNNLCLQTATLLLSSIYEKFDQKFNIVLNNKKETGDYFNHKEISKVNCQNNFSNELKSNDQQDNYYNNVLRDLYTIYFNNCVSTNASMQSFLFKNNFIQKLSKNAFDFVTLIKKEKYFIFKCRYHVNFNIFKLDTINVQNAIICMENEIKLEKDTFYLKQLMDYLFKDRDCNWYKFEISENLIGYFKDYFNSDLYSDYHPITFFNIIKYFIKNNIKFDINNVFDYYKSELVHNEIGPVLTLKDNRSALFNRGIVTSYQNYYLDKILEIYIDGKYTMEEKVIFVKKICSSYCNNKLKIDKSVMDLFTFNKRQFTKTNENLNNNLEKNFNNSFEKNINMNLEENLNTNFEKNLNINLENNLNSNLQKNLNINSEKTFNINLENNLNSNLQNINYLQNNGNILTINDFISIILSIYAKFKEGYFILEEEDLLNSVFAFINANKFYNLSELENFSEIFCLGLTSKEKFIRNNFFKLFDGMLSRDIKLRYKKLLSLNWSLANEYYIPFIICRLLLDCLDDFTLSTFRLFECGSYIYSNFRNQEEKEYKFKLSYDGYNVFINNICDWKRAINKFKLENFREVLYEHLYFFRNSNMYILNNLKLDVTDCFENMFYMVSVLEKKEDFSLLFLKQINEGKNSHIKSDNYSMFFSNKKNLKNSYINENTLKMLRNGPKCWFYILEHTNRATDIYKLLMNNDFYYASLRVNSKYPELSQISLYQQLGYFKEAQLLYKDLQRKAINKEISYFSDQFQIIYKEAMECSKELQQWDICYSVSKLSEDYVNECDSIFHSSNFNATAEREILKKSLYQYFLREKNLFNQKNNDKNVTYLNNEMSNLKNTSYLNSDDHFYKKENCDFSNIYAINGGKHKFYIKNNQKDFIRMRLYNLFLDLYKDFNIAKAVSLIRDINDIIQSGPNTKEFNEYYSILFQIIFEIYELSVNFNNQFESPERINNIIYRWEEREPLLENSFSNLLLFVNWRKHAFKKIDDFSNDLKFSASSENLHDITGILNKNKEFTDNSKLIKKSICTNANNGLGKMYLFLGLAAYNKKYYDVAVNFFETIFTLTSIKIVDAYYKVIYELMSYYEMKKYKLGLDLTNSSNILHFTDHQSSNICRTRGMFAEKLGQFNDAKFMYLQAIKLGEIGENYLRYIKLLIKNRFEWEELFNQENKFKINEQKLNDYNLNEQKIRNNLHEQRVEDFYSNDHFFNSNRNSIIDNSYLRNGISNEVNVNNVSCINNNLNNGMNNNLNNGINNNEFINNIYNNEILCSILKGLICADMEVAYDIMLIFLNFLNEQTIEIDIKLYTSLINSCNINIFVFFVYKLLDLYNTRKANRKYILIIMQKVYNEYPQAILNINNDANFPFTKNSEFVTLINKFINYAETIPFKNECELIDMVDSIITEITNLLNSNKKNNTRSRIKYLLHKFLNSIVMTKIPKNVYPFVQSLNNDIICPYKILEILMHIKYKVHLLILGSDHVSDSNFVNLYEEIKFDFDLVVFGSYNKIRNNYKNVDYVETFDHVIGECVKRKDIINSLYFTGTDGIFYQIQYHIIKEKNYNCNFIWEYCNYKLKSNYELRYREVEIPILKSQCLSKGKFVNIIERSIHDMKLIYYLFSISRSKKQLFLEYLKFFKINEHVCIYDENNDKDFDDVEEDLTDQEKIFKLFKNHFNSNEKVNKCSNSNEKINIETNIDKDEKHDCKSKIDNEKINIETNIDKDEKHDCKSKIDNEKIKTETNIDEDEQDKAPLEIDPTVPDIIDESSVIKLFNKELKVCQFVPKINNELRLKAFYKILKDVMPCYVLKDYMLGYYRDPFSFFQFKLAYTKSYSIHQLMNYLFYTVDISPSNIYIDEYYGNFINRNLFNLKLGNELTEGISTYISPNVQEFIGKEGMEGPLVSIIYHGCNHIKQKEFVDDLLKACGIKFDVMKKIENLLSKQDKDFNIIKIISEWCNPKKMSKIKISENPWL